MAADYTFDSAAEWGTGEFTDAHALDPSGKLVPGISSATLAELVANYNLSVYLRCRAGAGSTLENVGSAGDGTLSSASWQTRVDGRHYLSGGSVTVSYHSSMKVAETDDNDDETRSCNWTVQMRVRLSSYSAQVFLTRGNQFQLGIDASGYPYIKGHYDIEQIYNERISLKDHPQGDWIYLNHTTIKTGSIVITDDEGNDTGRSIDYDYTDGKFKFTDGGDYTGILWVDYQHHEATGWTEAKNGEGITLDEWVTLQASCTNGNLELYVDGERVAALETLYRDNDPGTDLVAACTEDWDQVMYSGNVRAFILFPNSGTWSKVVSLPGDRTLNYLELNCSLLDEHSLNARIAFADDVDELDYSDTWGWSADIVDGYNRLYPPERGLIHGSKMKLYINLSSAAYDRDAVLVDYLKVYLRTPATPLMEQVEEPYERLGVEEFVKEDLSSIVEQINAQSVVINQLSREIKDVRKQVTTSTGTGGSGDIWPASSGVSRSEVESMIAYHNSHYWGVHGVGTSRVAAEDWTLRNFPLKFAFENLSTNFWDHVVSKSTHGCILIASWADVGDEIDTHAARDTGVHGVGTDYVCGYSEAAGYNVNDHIAAGNPHDDSLHTDHAGATTAVHGLSSGQRILYVVAASPTAGYTQAEVASEIGTHEGSGTAHGSVESNFTTHAAAGNPHGDSLHTDHAGVSTAVHGLGAGQRFLYVVAGSPAAGYTQAEVASEIGTHEGSGTAHGSVESNFATHAAAANPHSDSLNISHASATTTIHGLSTGQRILYVVAASPAAGYTQAQVNSAIDTDVNTHEGSGTAHGSVESNFASHKDATTNIHGAGSYALQAADDVAAVVNAHSDLDTGVHGVESDYVAISIQSGDTVEDLIGDHDVDWGAHSDKVAALIDYTDAAEAHQDRCTAYAP